MSRSGGIFFDDNTWPEDAVIVPAWRTWLNRWRWITRNWEGFTTTYYTTRNGTVVVRMRPAVADPEEIKS